MRRLLLLATVLSLVGLSTAFAASLTVQTEDVASFGTDVAVTVPDQPTPFPSIIYIRGDSGTPPGALDLLTPVTNDSVTSKTLLRSPDAIEIQSDPAKYFAWESPAAPGAGYLLAGTVRLFIEQNGGGANLMTAGLFSCPAAAPVSTTTGAGQCALIGSAVAAPGGGGNGYQERTVTFAPIPSYLIPSGHQLRLKIVNRTPDGATVLSTADFTLQWGFLAARPSRLEITP